MSWYGSGSGAVTVSAGNLARFAAEERDESDTRDVVEWATTWLAEYDLEATFDGEGNLTYLTLELDEHSYSTPDDPLTDLFDYAEVGSRFEFKGADDDGRWTRWSIVESDVGRRWYIDETVHVYGNPREMTAEVLTILRKAHASVPHTVQVLLIEVAGLLDDFQRTNDWV